MSFLQTFFRDASKTAIGKFCVKHSPKIFIGLGVLSSIGFGVSMIFATKRTIDMIDEEETRRREIKTKAKIDGEEVEATVVDTKMSFKDIFIMSWKVWILPFSFFSISTVAYISAYVFEHGRGLTLASMLAASEGKLAALEQSVIEEVGEKKAEEIQDKVAQKIISEKKLGSDETKNNIVNERKRDCEYICYDPITDQEFWTTFTKLDYARMMCNRDLDRKYITWSDRNFVSVNDFITMAGGKRMKNFDNIGWSAKKHEELRISIRHGFTEKQEPCFELDYQDKPRWID